MAASTESEHSYGVFILLFVASILVLLARIYWVLIRREISRPKKMTRSVKSMIVAGSGGHTMEILALVSSLSKAYYPRLYIVADTDSSSTEKIQNVEKNKEYEIYKIPRSREVHQTWVTSVLTTAKSLLFSFPVVFRYRPDLVLCNGPGTCIPVCVAAFILKVVGVKAVSVVYVESVCRVETLSLSGNLLYYFADQVVVQWKQLQVKYPRTVYLGRLI